MSINRLRIATRKSPLALWQAEHVRTRLMQAHTGLNVELVTFSTKGDKILDTPLAKIGGKGLFVKELEQGMLAGDADIAFNPSGGFHHAHAAYASGFCYMNDVVIACEHLAAAGKRVFFLDIDAHHCDGVQDAFRQDPRVATMSIHERGRWPGTGAADDRGGGRSVNLPVPPQLNDDEFDFLLHEALIPAVDRFRPGAIVVTCGTDALAGDPLAGMALSNLALWDAVESLCRLAPVRIVLGGGGYNPWTLARCWTGLWGRLSGREIPVELPAAAQVILRGLACDLIDEEEVEAAWLTTLADAPRHGEVRAEVRELARLGRARHGMA